LQQVDAHFQSSDAALIKALRATAQSVFGRSVTATKTHSQEPGWGGSGSGYMWKDEDQKFMETVNQQEFARLQLYVAELKASGVV
jgi:hypothetical protein